MAKKIRINKIEFARQQRKLANAYEQKMWFLLRNRRLASFKFRRQHPIEPYTLDFYCPRVKLDVEIDGDSHITEKGRSYDLARDQFLAKLGIRVLRYSGKRVELEGRQVLDEIETVLRERDREK